MFPFQRWKRRGINLSPDLPKVTQVGSARARLVRRERNGVCHIGTPGKGRGNTEILTAAPRRRISGGDAPRPPLPPGSLSSRLPPLSPQKLRGSQGGIQIPSWGSCLTESEHPWNIRRRLSVGPQQALPPSVTRVAVFKSVAVAFLGKWWLAGKRLIWCKHLGFKLGQKVQKCHIHRRRGTRGP